MVKICRPLHSSVDVMQTYQLSAPRNVTRNKSVLIDNDIAQQNENGLELLDPSFEIWLRKLFFNEPYV